MENRIAELKHDLGADGFCMKQFFATEAAFRAVLLLFNLLAEFQRAAGLPGYREPATIRTQVLTCGAILGRAGRRAGDSSIGKLGWIEDANPFARQHLELANSNFAEVGIRHRHLIPCQHYCRSLYFLISEFRLRRPMRRKALACLKPVARDTPNAFMRIWTALLML